MFKLSKTSYFGKPVIAQMVDTKTHFSYNRCNADEAVIFPLTVVQHWKVVKMAKTEKKFTVAGTAAHKGSTKVRFANDLVARIKILTKAGCTDINLVELPKPMTKIEALQHLQSLGTYNGDAGFAVANKLAEKTKIAKKGEVKVAAKGAKVSTKTKAKAEEKAEVKSEGNTETA